MEADRIAPFHKGKEYLNHALSFTYNVATGLFAISDSGGTYFVNGRN
jgi:hypothetical protein